MKRPTGCLVEVVETLLLTLVIFFVVQAFVAQPYRVEQESMRRTLEPDQYVLVDKLTPRFDDYKRGDIVVFNPPAAWQQTTTSPFIKRVIGVGGDKVEVHDGKVWVNGTALDEPYVYDHQPTSATSDQSSWVVPQGQLFVMGDHRSNSADSRVFGPIDKTLIIGRAFLRYWPIGTFGILPTPTYSAPSSTPGSSASPASSSRSNVPLAPIASTTSAGGLAAALIATP
jgi:signal peptidase I